MLKLLYVSLNKCQAILFYLLYLKYNNINYQTFAL